MKKETWKQVKKETLISMWSHLGPFWSVKYLNLWAKATDSDSPSYFSKKYHTFLERRLPEVTKIYLMFCPSLRTKYQFSITFQLMDYNAFCKCCTVNGAKMHMKILVMGTWGQNDEYSRVWTNSKGFFNIF